MRTDRAGQPPPPHVSSAPVVPAADEGRACRQLEAGVATRERQLDVLFWAHAALTLPEGSPGAGPRAPQVVAAYEAVAQAERTMRARMEGSGVPPTGAFDAVLALAGEGEGSPGADSDRSCQTELGAGHRREPSQGGRMDTLVAAASGDGAASGRPFWRQLLHRWAALSEQGRRLLAQLSSPHLGHVRGGAPSVEGGYRVASHLADAMAELQNATRPVAPAPRAANTEG